MRHLRSLPVAILLGACSGTEASDSGQATSMSRLRPGVVGLPMLLSLVVLYLPACTGSNESPLGAVTLEDSAGIRIVNHAAGPFLDTVPLEPVLSIGREGDPDYEFFGVHQVSPLGSGNVVVTNGGTSELMFYGPEGEYLRRVGQRGEGPSEFGFLTTVYTRDGDTLTVMDPRLLASHEGELWARWAERPSEETIRWTVYSADRQTIRRVVLPKIDVHAIRDGRIYGHTEDDLGIQTVLVLEDTGM